MYPSFKHVQEKENNLILLFFFQGASCVHWMHYGEATKAREGWAQSLLEEFKLNVEMLKSAVRDQQCSTTTHSSPQHGKHTYC